jgi:uroporphyrinogen-III synthase
MFRQRCALLTRPREESEALAAALASRGVDALIEPMMEVHFHAVPRLEIARLQAVLCTSANGVRALARASAERGMRIFAVGEATAARARAEGFGAVETAGGDVGDLVRLAVARLDPQQGPLLHVAGRVVAGDLVGALRTRGFTIKREILYDARPVERLSPTAVGALRAGAVDFAIFFSPRTAEVFVRLARGASVREYCRTITTLSISPAADAALGGLTWFDRRIAGRPNQPALLGILDCVLDERQLRPVGNQTGKPGTDVRRT